MDENMVHEPAEHEPYPLQFTHVDGGEYEFYSDELGAGRVERAGSLGQRLEEDYEEEQAIAGSPPKMLPPPFPMHPAGKNVTSIPLNNPPAPSNEQQQQQQQQQQQEKEEKEGKEASA